MTQSSENTDVAQLQAALHASAARAASQRQRIADYTAELLTENDQLQAIKEDLVRERSLRKHYESELKALQNTKTFRATTWLRNMYARFRGHK